MLTTQVENWSVLEREAQEMFKVHYDALALHKQEMPLGIDSAAYLDMERRGYLLVVTARRDGVLVGYHIWIVLDHHIHNKAGGKVATSDMFFVLPEHRRGGAGAKLLMASKVELKKIGVKKASLSTKIHFENSELLDALGWEPTDIVRQMIL